VLKYFINLHHLGYRKDIKGLGEAHIVFEIRKNVELSLHFSQKKILCPSMFELFKVTLRVVAMVI
jgi:hypothetical protein